MRTAGRQRQAAGRSWLSPTLARHVCAGQGKKQIDAPLRLHCLVSLTHQGHALVLFTSMCTMAGLCRTEGVWQRESAMGSRL